VSAEVAKLVSVELAKFNSLPYGMGCRLFVCLFITDVLWLNSE